jgi:hypothetical protein
MANATYATAYIGVSADTKPTGVAIGSTFYETDTHQKHITADGSTWGELEDLDAVVLGAGAATIGNVTVTGMGEIQDTPTAYTLLRRLKDLLTGITLAGTTVTKTVQTPLLAYTAIAANAQQESSEMALTNVKKVTLFIEHARDAARNTEFWVHPRPRVATAGFLSFPWWLTSLPPLVSPRTPKKRLLQPALNVVRLCRSRVIMCFSRTLRSLILR